MGVNRFLGAVTLAVAGLAAVPAQAYYALNGFVIEPIGAGQMQVFPRGGLTAPDGWCAAGDYVIAMLNMPPATPIWRITPPPHRRGESIVFSLSPEGATPNTGLNTIGAAPIYVTAGAARSYCRQSIEYWTMR